MLAEAFAQDEEYGESLYAMGMSLLQMTASIYAECFLMAYLLSQMSDIYCFSPFLLFQSHGEELRFVENGCHDNPTLDVASDSQSEMQEKKPSVNGGAAINGPESWDVLINKQAGEEGDAFEEDTHL